MQHLDDLEQRVIAVIAKQTGLQRDRIKPEMLVEHELGCTGEDAWELMETMQREFGIDMTGIDLNRHFDREGGVGWPLVVILVVALPFSLMSMPPIGSVYRVIGYVA